ncbi:hypothetical protein MDOR_04450 [Mycolicibacterium doricum]|uniref:Uncharacterized protein n=1 Tax=Mycolicibacterium doricum TaxID=126673 RepID=A0A7I7VLU6_9MYCO|nr:hypothetical protein [Mycolicibacterium doricum]BBZ06276.1 hypothetical protein MDOR_04450 [Mycolicibacterium doricum]
MLVDPGILRAFAGQVDIVAADVGATEVGGRTFSAGDVLPGSTMQAAVREHFSQMATTLSQNVTKTATPVRGASDPFEVATTPWPASSAATRVSAHSLACGRFRR